MGRSPALGDAPRGQVVHPASSEVCVSPSRSGAHMSDQAPAASAPSPVPLPLQSHPPSSSLLTPWPWGMLPASGEVLLRSHWGQSPQEPESPTASLAEGEQPDILSPAAPGLFSERFLSPNMIFYASSKSFWINVSPFDS